MMRPTILRGRFRPIPIHGWLLGIVLLLAALSLVGAASASEDGALPVAGFEKRAIGRLALVFGAVQVMDKWGQRHSLIQGEEIYQGDVVTTGSKASALLTMLDQTQISLGENAKASLDHYRFAPGKKIGRLEASVLAGIMHYRSGGLGALSQKRDHTFIRLPQVGIGIRGSEFNGEVAGDGASTILHKAGQLSMMDQDGELLGELNSAGNAFSIDSEGKTRFFTADKRLTERLESGVSRLRSSRSSSGSTSRNAPPPDANRTTTPVASDGGGNGSPPTGEGGTDDVDSPADNLMDEVNLDPESAKERFREALAQGEMSVRQALEAVLLGLQASGDMKAVRELLEMAANAGLSLEDAKLVVEKMRKSRPCQQ
ncbi:MAG: FecR domain-containing protein [Magnetococcales bacterium]|nr:FecR domain-containing protein [Magnetococcales bacterium]